MARRGRRVFGSRFAEPAEETALIGAGTTHHIAWRAADDAEQQAWLQRLVEVGLRPTPVQDRKYFRSIYFRMPDGILLEIATDGPGFLVDEPRETLGEGLALPPWLEPERATLEASARPSADAQRRARAARRLAERCHRVGTELAQKRAARICNAVLQGSLVLGARRHWSAGRWSGRNVWLHCSASTRWWRNW